LVVLLAGGAVVLVSGGAVALDGVSVGAVALGRLGLAIAKTRKKIPDKAINATPTTINRRPRLALTSGGSTA
jgi:hypothetical protein